MKTTLQLDQKCAQELITRLEPKALHISDLCKQVADLYNKEKGTKISFSTFSLRIKQGVLKTNIKAGKRGLAAGVVLTSEQKLAMQAGRKRGVKRINSAEADALRKAFPAHSGTVEAFIEGKKRSGDKLMCLSCAGEGTGCIRPGNGFIETIKTCKSFDCPNHSRRPYK